MYGGDLTEMAEENIILTYSEEGIVSPEETARRKGETHKMIAEMKRRGYKNIDLMVEEAKKRGQERNKAKLRSVS
jgi:hypothetical protein